MSGRQARRREGTVQGEKGNIHWADQKVNTESVRKRDSKLKFSNKKFPQQTRWRKASKKAAVHEKEENLKSMISNSQSSYFNLLYYNFDWWNIKSRLLLTIRTFRPFTHLRKKTFIAIFQNTLTWTWIKGLRKTGREGKS